MYHISYDTKLNESKIPCFAHKECVTYLYRTLHLVVPLRLFI